MPRETLKTIKKDMSIVAKKEQIKKDYIDEIVSRTEAGESLEQILEDIYQREYQQQ